MKSKSVIDLIPKIIHVKLFLGYLQFRKSQEDQKIARSFDHVDSQSGFTPSLSSISSLYLDMAHGSLAVVTMRVAWMFSWRKKMRVKPLGL